MSRAPLDRAARPRLAGLALALALPLLLLSWTAFATPAGAARTPPGPAAARGTRAGATARAAPAGARRHAHIPRAEVVTVQRLFRVLGYPLGDMPLGGLGVRTRGALSYFQHKYHLPVTGYPDARTIARMRAVAASLTAPPKRPPASARRDLVDRLLPDVPILPLGILCALALALLALVVDRKATAET